MEAEDCLLHPGIDHDEFGLNQSKFMSVIDSIVGAGFSRKPVPTFRIPRPAGYFL